MLHLVLAGAWPPAEGGYCPSNHPFAFSDGKKCCATAMEDGFDHGASILFHCSSYCGALPLNATEIVVYKNE